LVECGGGFLFPTDIAKKKKNMYIFVRIMMDKLGRGTLDGFPCLLGWFGRALDGLYDLFHSEEVLSILLDAAAGVLPVSPDLLFTSCVDGDRCHCLFAGGLQHR
jgi:hypothetical protein